MEETWDGVGCNIISGGVNMQDCSCFDLVEFLPCDIMEDGTYTGKGIVLTLDNRNYKVVKVIAIGSSGIIYDVCELDENQQETKIHYVMKEYYPIDLSEEEVLGEKAIKRSKDNVTVLVDETVKKEFDRGLLKFKGESDNGYLPESNSELGIHFFYSSKTVLLNGTAYILYQTEACETFCSHFKSDEQIDLKGIVTALKDVSKALEFIHKTRLHLDISDKNVVVSSDGRAKLIDFGNSVNYTDAKNKIVEVNDDNFVIGYTDAFAPIELQMVANGYTQYNKLTCSSDLYSICAILFKYVFGRNYISGLDNVDDVWENIVNTDRSRSRMLKKYGRAVLLKIKSVLAKGLSGPEARYQTADELIYDFEKVLACIKKEEKNKHRVHGAAILFGFTIVFIVVFHSILYRCVPPPEAKIGRNIDLLYSKGENIFFSVMVSDEDVAEGIYSIERITRELKLNGFTADKYVSINHYDGNKQMEISYNLKNIISDCEGEKSISVGKVYKKRAGVGQKSTGDITCFFNYFDKNITAEISQPSYEKISSPFQNEILYNIKFSSPTEYSGSIETVGRSGFTCESCSCTKLDETTYQLSFKGIQGDPGECYFTLKADCVTDEHGRSLKETTSPKFKIVEEEIDDMPIRARLELVERKLYQGGYLVINCDVVGGFSSIKNNKELYEGDLRKENIRLENFEGDIKVVGNTVIVANISYEEHNIDKMKVVLDDGVFYYYENGTVNSESEVFVNRKINQDSTVPSIAMTKPEVLGDSVLFTIYISDDSGEAYFENCDFLDYIKTIGFSYKDVSVRKGTSTAAVVFSGVKMVDEKVTVIEVSGGKSHEVVRSTEGKGYITLKAGFVVDGSGNKSKVISSSKFQILGN